MKESVGGMVFNGDQVFPTLVTSLLPDGVRGLVVACLLAALMSSLASLFNSAATLFTIDMYEKLRPGKPEKHLVMVGRLATCVVVLLGILWIPVMARVSGGGLYQYLQSVQGYLAPPITVWGLGAGFLLGMAKLTIQTFFGAGKIAEPRFLANVGDFNFLYATGLLFVVSVAIVLVASLVTAPPPEEKWKGLTWKSVCAEAGDELKASWDLGNKILSALVLAIVAAVYIYFSFWLS
jgi:SSS family solute:Na+ symporter